MDAPWCVPILSSTLNCQLSHAFCHKTPQDKDVAPGGRLRLPAGTGSIPARAGCHVRRRSRQARLPAHALRLQLRRQVRAPRTRPSRAHHSPAGAVLRRQPALHAVRVHPGQRRPLHRRRPLRPGHRTRPGRVRVRQHRRRHQDLYHALQLRRHAAALHPARGLLPGILAGARLSGSAFALRLRHRDRLPSVGYHHIQRNLHVRPQVLPFQAGGGGRFTPTTS